LVTTLLAPRHSAVEIGRVAALLALVALLVGGSLMAATAPLVARAGDDVWGPVQEHPGLFWSAALALALISLFDLFTIPALHLRLHAGHPKLILLATVTAAVGDLLGLLGRLVQGAEVPAAASPAGADLLAILEQTLNTAGFALVSVSFTCFGFAMLRGFSRWLGWVGLVAGVCTALGQYPGLEPAFALANLAFIAWYVGLVVTLRRTTPSGTGVSGEAASRAAAQGSPL
jgi:hypothetical protein